MKKVVKGNVQLNTVRNSIKKLFSRDIIGVFVGSNDVQICNCSGFLKSYSIEEISNPSNDYEKKLLDSFNFISNKFTRFLPLRILFPLKTIICTEYNSPKMSDLFYNKAAESFNLEIYRINFNMCLAVGMGLAVTDRVKNIIIIVSQNEIHGFILFAAGIFNEIKIKYNYKKPLKQTILGLVRNLEKSSSKDIPNDFLEFDLSPEELSDISEGWQSSFCNQLNIVFINNHSLPIEETIAEFNVVVFNNVTNYIKVGLQEITRNFRIWG